MKVTTSMVQDTIETAIDMKSMREHKEKIPLAIRRVSWEQKSNVRRTSLGRLLGATLVKEKRSQRRYTSTLNRVACRPLEFCLLETFYQSVFSVLIFRTQQRPLRTNRAVRHFRPGVYYHNRFSFFKKK